MPIRQGIRSAGGAMLAVAAIVLTMAALKHSAIPGGRLFWVQFELGFAVGLSLWSIRVIDPGLRPLAWTSFVLSASMTLLDAYGLAMRAFF
jgi:hypothetical protein